MISQITVNGTRINTKILSTVTIKDIYNIGLLTVNIEFI